MGWTWRCSRRRELGGQLARNRRCRDDRGSTSTVSDATNSPGEASPDAAPAPTAQDQSPDSSVRAAHRRWATSSWWGAACAAEFGVLVALGYMAWGERYPLVRTFVPPMSHSYLEPLNSPEVVGGVILVGVAIWSLALIGRWWWKPGLAAALALTLAVVVSMFGWGSPDRRLLLGDLPLWATLACWEEHPAAHEEATRRGRISHECRDTGLAALSGSSLEQPGMTTTTQPTIEIARLDLALALTAPDRDALKMLANAYEAMARSLDNPDQAALIAWHTANQLGDQKLVDDVTTVGGQTWEPLDASVLQVANQAHNQLLGQLPNVAWTAIDRYLSLTQLRHSDFDRFLDVLFRLNLIEINAVLDAVN